MTEEKKNSIVNPHTGKSIEDAPFAPAAPASPADEIAPSTAAPPSADAPPDPAITPAGTAGATSADESADTPAPSQQELAVRAALENVMDPEINLSVIDLGLIREIHLFPDRTFIRMMLTTPFCPYAPQLMADVKQATTAVVPLPCEVEIMPDAWSPDLMPDPSLLGFSY